MLFSILRFDLNLRHKIFLNLIFRLRKNIFKILETRGYYFVYTNYCHLVTKTILILKINLLLGIKNFFTF